MIDLSKSSTGNDARVHKYDHIYTLRQRTFCSVCLENARREILLMTRQLGGSADVRMRKVRARQKSRAVSLSEPLLSQEMMVAECRRTE